MGGDRRPARPAARRPPPPPRPGSRRCSPAPAAAAAGISTDGYWSASAVAVAITPSASCRPLLGEVRCPSARPAPPQLGHLRRRTGSPSARPAGAGRRRARTRRRPSPCPAGGSVRPSRWPTSSGRRGCGRESEYRRMASSVRPRSASSPATRYAAHGFGRVGVVRLLVERGGLVPPAEFGQQVGQGERRGPGVGGGRRRCGRRPAGTAAPPPPCWRSVLFRQFSCSASRNGQRASDGARSIARAVTRLRLRPPLVGVERHAQLAPGGGASRVGEHRLPAWPRSPSGSAGRSRRPGSPAGRRPAGPRARCT